MTVGPGPGLGYVFVLSCTGAAGGYTFRLDIYTPDGSWLARSTGMTAGKLAVGLWRDLYTLTYQALRLPNGNSPAVTEPSISRWIPSTPPA